MAAVQQLSLADPFHTFFPARSISETLGGRTSALLSFLL